VSMQHIGTHHRCLIVIHVLDMDCTATVHYGSSVRSYVVQPILSLSWCSFIEWTQTTGSLKGWLSFGFCTRDSFLTTTRIMNLVILILKPSQRLGLAAKHLCSDIFIYVRLSDIMIILARYVDDILTTDSCNTRGAPFSTAPEFHVNDQWYKC